MISQYGFLANGIPTDGFSVARYTGIRVRSERFRDSKAKENDKEKEEGERKADREEISKAKIFQSDSPARLPRYLRFGV